MFKGESFPLVVIECLHAGRPVLATDIGEVKEMLSTPEGLAGEVLELRKGKIEVKDLAQAIIRFVTDEDYYLEKKQLVPLARKKFDLERMLQEYEEVYARVFSSLSS